ncbi:glutathione peroxidase [Aquisediminimonas sediminicola]|uniref:glutathione peroxidase n=1 Tax=Alteraquisediminimonas sediminicola TaxID=2676787 RepID=UPI001C8E4051|nr:redoxin domain-containing protein [Aquisediminimonas sediminicola]
MSNKVYYALAALALAGGIGGAVWAKLRPAPTPTLPAADHMTAWDFNLVAIDGTPMPMRQFKNKVVLLVNTASFCGYTPQYDGLQKLHLAYQAKGFTVIGVPSGNFLDQEYTSNKDISKFCKAKFGIRFPLAERGDVVGPKAIPIYRWAASILGADNTPRWNFHKYLIGRDGRLIRAFGTKIEPMSPDIVQAVEQALGK